LKYSEFKEMMNQLEQYKFLFIDRKLTVRKNTSETGIMPIEQSEQKVKKSQKNYQT